MQVSYVLANGGWPGREHYGEMWLSPADPGYSSVRSCWTGEVSEGAQNGHPLSRL